jgi:hypothetical protein
MRRRRRVLALVAVAMLAAAGGVALVTLDRRPRITSEQCERVHIGMTLEEVVAILGVPPGDYSYSETVEVFDRTFFGELDQDYASVRTWVADSETPRRLPDGQRRHAALVIRVRIDSEGKVIGKRARSASYGDPPVSYKIKRWLDSVRAKLGL